MTTVPLSRKESAIRSTCLGIVFGGSSSARKNSIRSASSLSAITPPTRLQRNENTKSSTSGLL